MDENRDLSRELSSSCDEEFLDEGSIVHSVVPSPYISKLSFHFRRTATRAEAERGITLSFVVIYAMIFFNGCCFTAVVPSVPFYLAVLDAPPTFLGWVVSFYSLGQIVSSPIGGWMADKMSSRALLTMSSSLGLASSVLYSMAPTYMFILLSRFLTGISAGTEFSVELTFIARNTTKKERTLYLASVTAVNVVGFVVGPALGGLLGVLDLTIAGVHVDKYTGPGWLLTMMFLVDILMVQNIFQDDLVSEDRNKDDNREREPTEVSGLLQGKKQTELSYGGPAADEKEAESAIQLPTTLRDSARPPLLSIVLGLIFVQFTVMSAWSVLETITSPLVQSHFDWDVQECNLLFTGGGFVSLVTYFLFLVASKRIKDRWLIVDALVVCLLGQMLAIDWQELEWVPHYFSRLQTGYRNRFLIGYALMNAGFITARPVTFALYSKLISSQYQGKYLGWMVAGGSLARTLGPFAAVAIYYGVKTTGANLLVLFGLVGMFHVACLILVIFLWQRLLPKDSQVLTPGTTDEESDEKTEILDLNSRLTDRLNANCVASFDDNDNGMCYINKKHAYLSLRVTDEEKRTFFPPINATRH